MSNVVPTENADTSRNNCSSPAPRSSVVIVCGVVPLPSVSQDVLVQMPSRFVSTDGGTEPVWTSRGRALLYRNGSSLVRVAIGDSPEFTMGRRDTLVRETLRENYRAGYFHAMYDVSPDGRRFAFTRPGADPAELVEVLHFDAEVRARTGKSTPRR